MKALQPETSSAINPIKATKPDLISVKTTQQIT
jgi:hypothetical protein